MTSEHQFAVIEAALAYRVHRIKRMLLTHIGRFMDSRGTNLSAEKCFIVMKLLESGALAQSELVESAFDDGPNVSRLVELTMTSYFGPTGDAPGWL